MKARDYLYSKGLAKPGRGKFSNEAKLELTKAIGSGVKFSDWPKSTTAPVGKSSGPRLEVESPVDSPYLHPSDFRFPEDEYVAKGSNGKRYSMRECCNNCKASLTNHACNNPTVYGDIAVTIERR